MNGVFQGWTQAWGREEEEETLFRSGGLWVLQEWIEPSWNYITAKEAETWLANRGSDLIPRWRSAGAIRNCADA